MATGNPQVYLKSGFRLIFLEMPQLDNYLGNGSLIVWEKVTEKK